MKRIGGAAIGATLVALAMLGSQSLLVSDEDEDRRSRSLKASLTGFQEPPAVSSTGSGEFKARISDDELSLDYELSYEDLEGTVTQSHIHLGQVSVNGGIAIWLCQTATNPAPTAVTPVCPSPNAGTVTGTVTAAEVIGPAGQGIAPGEFAEVLRALRKGVTYANVHSTKHPGGEIRGQINGRGRDD